MAFTIYTFPPALWRVADVTFPTEPRSVSTSPSAFNPQVFQDGPTSEFWTVAVELTPMDEDQYRELQAFLRVLKGSRNKVRINDPSRPLRGAGALGGTAQINANAVAGANSITIRGLIPSQARALAADDMLGLGENLHAVDFDAPSNASGEATVTISPPLRVGVADGDVVNFNNPTGLFMRTSKGSPRISARRISEPLTLEFMEAPDFE